MLAALGAPTQTPGDIGYFPTRRVSSACRFYGAPYYTEPPGNVPREREIQRIWMDVSNGTQVWFDYPQNLDRARDIFREYKEHLTGQPPICDLAFILPTTHHWLHPGWTWPPRLAQYADAARPLFDYEVVSEEMICDGALVSMDIRIAILVEGDVMEARTLHALKRWVDSGGTLVVVGMDHVETVEGDESLFSPFLPPAPHRIEDFLAYGPADPVPKSIVIDVGSPGDAPFLFGKWHLPEQLQPDTPTMRWTGRNAGLNVPVGPNTEYRMEIKAWVREFTPKVPVLVNGVEIGAMTPEMGEVFEAAIPPSVVGGKPEIRIEIAAEVWIPSQVGAAEDARELGVYVDWLRLTESSFEPEAPIATNVAPCHPVMDIQKVFTWCAIPVGKGRVVYLPGDETYVAPHVRAISKVSHNLSEFVGGASNAILADGRDDQVLTTVFADRILYYNPTDLPIRKHVVLREKDFGHGTGVPEKYEWELELGPREIRAVWLR
jgi:hypothetical protein